MDIVAYLAELIGYLGFFGFILIETLSSMRESIMEDAFLLGESLVSDE
jgi:hypothetical protein